MHVDPGARFTVVRRAGPVDVFTWYGRWLYRIECGESSVVLVNKTFWLDKLMDRLVGTNTQRWRVERE